MREESKHVRSSRRARWLLVLLSILTVIVIVRGAHGLLPHEPRLFLVNESLGILEDLVIHSDCGDFPLPKLAEWRSYRLKLMPRSGCVYEVSGFTFEGEYLLRLIESGREQKADVVITVGFDFVEADLMRGYKFW